ncbi:hypothetical protein [Flavobacterium cyclinae]|uniref:hypothetical protein n=1 Tax=Flavobacterium cyclinae TaxID=2895947 RepID=UPI001E5BCCE0|nr:hypothetical protein [Flavobacterium cyclinae]UGS21052.1 hypothetical protein LOS86_00065 [Flavobacterium cyclinae]
MKSKIIIYSLILLPIMGFSGEKKSTIKNADACTDVYRATRDAALAEGFNYTKAQQIGAAAYYSCRAQLTKN